MSTSNLSDDVTPKPLAKPPEEAVDDGVQPSVAAKAKLPTTTQQHAIFAAVYRTPVTSSRLGSSLLSLFVHVFLLGLLLVSPYLLRKTVEVKASKPPAFVHLYLAPHVRAPNIVVPRLTRVERPPAAKAALTRAVVVRSPAAPPALSTTPQTVVTIPPAPPEVPQRAVMPQSPLEVPVKGLAPAEVFSSLQQPTPDVGHRETKVGEFGDVNGVKPADAKTSQSTRVGGFDNQGLGTSGHQGGNGRRGSYEATAFGAAGEIGSGVGTKGVVPTGGFEAAYANRQGQPAARTKLPESKAMPVEILAKPKPEYTAEARALRIEGDVSLEVIFLASGGVRVIRLVHGLGHGLDEEAQRVAREIRFRPGIRDGVPVDSKAIIRVTFELT